MFFSYRPEREWENKRFVRRDLDKSRQAAGLFYEHSRRAVEASPFPVIEVNGADQAGEAFGPRLTNAIAEAFARGYEHVIAVGSDCPTLHEVNWKRVARGLDEGRPVLGPTSDGEGAYLIGLDRAFFERSAFEALPWTTPRLLESLSAHLTGQAQFAPLQLQPRRDVNDQDDLIALVEADGASSRVLVAQLRALLGPDEPAVRTLLEGGSVQLQDAPSRDPPSPVERTVSVAGSTGERP